MKNQSQFTIILGLAIACAFSLINPGLAQSQSDVDPYQSNEKDSMSGTLGDLNPMDLIHNMNLSTGRNAEEFNQDSQTQIQDSAAEFRRLQQERMQQQNNTVPKSNQEQTK